MHRMIAIAVAALLVAGCGSGDEPTLNEPTPTTSTSAPVEAPPPTPSITEGIAREVAPEPEPVAELDTEGVLAATLLIASGGDLEAAITAGIIGEAEAEAALAALETGSILDVLD